MRPWVYSLRLRFVLRVVATSTIPHLTSFTQGHRVLSRSPVVACLDLRGVRLGLSWVMAVGRWTFDVYPLGLLVRVVSLA